MSVNDDLGQRMKTYYEQIPQTKLLRRTPVAIRIDGKTFHTFTRGFQKPFDEILGNTMIKTMEYLCKNIQNCEFGYTQSDEITLLLIDYKELDSSAWFDYEVQKMCSIAASMATMAFNKFFAEEVSAWDKKNSLSAIAYNNGSKDPAIVKLHEVYWAAHQKGAMFDARVFNIPKEEVCNLIYWRQLDATRNSIQMVGQANFSHKELQGKSCNTIQDMLHEECGINWNNYPTRWKRGVACRKVTNIETLEEATAWGEPNIFVITRCKWEIDFDMPILKGEDRKYIEDIVYVGE